MRQLLGNIMWNCLSGPHARFATGSGAVRRYAPGFSPIVGCENPEQPDFETLLVKALIRIPRNNEKDSISKDYAND